MQSLIISTIVCTLMATYSYGAFASLMRLRYGDSGPIGMGYQQLLLPGILFLSFALLVKIRRIHVDKFAVVLLSVVVYGVIRGAVRNDFNSFFVAHLFQGMFALGLYLTGFNLRDENARLFIRQLRVLAYVVTVIHVGVMALYVYWLATAGIYFGMSASILILAVTIFIFDRQWYWAGLAGFMVIITGKRGEIAGLVLAILISLIIQGQVSGARRAIKQFVIGIIGASVLLLAVQVVFGVDIFAAVGSKFAQAIQGDFSDLSSQDAKVAIGGRAVELFVFFQTFSESGYSPLLLGLGYGWSVPVDVPGYEENEALHFVHVSPLNAVAQCGLLFAAVYWVYLVSIVVRAIRSGSCNRLLVPLIPYVAAMVVISLTAYVVAVDPMFWLCIGLIGQGKSGLCAHDRLHSALCSKI